MNSFQTITFLLAFLAAGINIFGSFSDWDEDPIITTLHSIADSIEGIQFPTVTVCDREYKPPDNWALLEWILNQLAFSCSDSYIFKGENRKWNPQFSEHN